MRRAAPARVGLQDVFQRQGLPAYSTAIHCPVVATAAKLLWPPR